MASMLRALVIAMRMLLALSAAGHDHGHSSGTSGFEWAGIFETPEEVYMWTAQKVLKNGVMQYADATMKMVALPAGAATDAKLHELEPEGEHGLNLTTCTEVDAGGIITPIVDVCYELHFKEDWWQSPYTINATGANSIAFFTQHVPVEFENTAHYLKDDHGDDIEPLAELPEAPATSTSTDEGVPWGPAIGSAIIVNLTTFIGVIFLVPFFTKLSTSYAVEFEGLISGFAAGALLACAFFLLLFEATHLINVGQTEEVQTVWRWGVMIMAGFLLPSIIQIAMGAVDDAMNKNKLVDMDLSTGEAAGETSSVDLSARARAIGGVLIGDFFHNLCDGFILGFAFKACGKSFGWGVFGGTVAHELAQEISDYFILTGSVGRLRPLVALGLNFLSGMSVLLGAIIVLAGEVPDADQGLLLAFGGGVYLHIAATECMPKIYSPKLSVAMRAASLGTFVLGATLIGLVLLDHEHCVPSGGAAGGHGHHGHGHGH